MNRKKISIAISVTLAIFGSLSAAANAQSVMFVGAKPAPASVLAPKPAVAKLPVKSVDETMPEQRRPCMKGYIVKIQSPITVISTNVATVEESIPPPPPPVTNGFYSSMCVPTNLSSLNPYAK